MDEQSFENFLLDTQIRSFECNDWITEEMNKLDSSIETEIGSLTKSKRDAFEEIFQGMLKTLQENVKILYRGEVIASEHVEYHKKFGWVLKANPKGAVDNEAKIFLGKLSLIENTQILMGKRTYISGPNIIRGGAELKVGSFCSLGEHLFINTSRDGHPLRCPSTVNFAGNSRIVEDGFDIPTKYSEFDTVKNGVEIGNDVWVARRVRISNGVKIGGGCVIAEGSLVRNDCEPYGIYGGTPAKLIRYRFDQDVIEQLLNLRWWDWPMEKICNNKTFFEADLTDRKVSIKNLIS